MQDKLEGLDYAHGELSELVSRILNRWRTNRSTDLLKDKFWTGKVGDVIVRSTSSKLILDENDVNKETIRGDQTLYFIRSKSLRLEKLTMFLENNRTFRRAVCKWKLWAWKPPNGVMVVHHWNELQNLSHKKISE